MRYIRFLCFFLSALLAATPAFAVDNAFPNGPTQDGLYLTPINFGTIYILPNTTVTVTIAANSGALTVSAGGFSGNNHILGKIPVKRSSLALFGETATLRANNTSLSGVIPLSNQTFSPASISLPNASSSGYFNWGGTIVIPANCASGVYSAPVMLYADSSALAVGTRSSFTNQPVTVTIKKALTISVARHLHFGNLFRPATGGTAVISYTGGNSATGDVGWINNLLISQAEFSVTGEPSAAVSVTLPSSAYNVTYGANSMNVSNFTSNAGNQIMLNGSGNATINVGATLTVNAGQSIGTYTNTSALIVTVSY